MKLKRLILLMLFSFVMFIFVVSAAHSQQTAADKDKFGGTLTIAVGKDFKSLDSRYLSKSGSSTRGQQQLYNRLVEYGPGGTDEIVPGLAEEWKQVDDVTWMVKIRKGVKFHNGKELTADDITANHQWKLRSKHFTETKGWRPPRGRNDIVSVKNVETVDKYTVKFTLRYPVVPFVPVNLAWAVRGIIDPDVVEKYENQATRHPVGTGPFKFVKYVAGSHLIMDRFDDYWGGRPYLDRIIIRIIPDAQTRLIALLKGEVDISTDLRYSNITQLTKAPNLKYYLVNDSRRGSWGNLYFNFRRWPMNQLKFRQALAMGANWKYIGKVIFPKEMTEDVNRYTLFERSKWENKEAKKIIPRFDPDAAKRLIKEVEKEAGKPIPPIYAMTNKGHQNIPGAALTIGVQQLKSLGLKINHHLLEEEVMKDKYRRDPKCDWDIMITSYKSPGIDPSETVGDFYSKLNSGGDGQNIPAYNNTEWDKLIVAAQNISDFEKRRKAYHEIERIILSDLAILPLYDIPYVRGYNKKVRDFPNHNSGHPIFVSAWNNVWLEKN